MIDRDKDRIDLPSPLEAPADPQDLVLVDQILKEVHAMRVKTEHRRLHRRRIALAASILLLFAGAGAFGYLFGTKPVDEQADPRLATIPEPSAPRTHEDRPALPPSTEIPAPKEVALTDKGRFGRLAPIAPSVYSMPLDGRDIPLYSADEPGANPALRHYVYAAPIRVVEAPRFDPKSNQVAVTLDMTAPGEARDEASKKVADALAEEGATRPKVIVAPLAFRSYTVQLIAEKAEGAFEIGSGGDRTTAVLTADKITFNAVVPESMPVLREKLRDTPGEVRVQLRAEYDFERAVKGSVNLARADGAVHRVLEEVRPKFPDGKVPPELYVDRQARDFVQARLGDSIKSVESNSGLSDEAFAAFLADARLSVNEYFASLPRRDPYQLITRDTNEVALIFTAPTGHVDARAILTRDKVTYREKSEEYTRKASEALKVVQDVLRKGKGEFSRASHKEMRDRLKLDGEASVGIAIFNASAKLNLDRSSEQLTDDQLKTMNQQDNRDYWTNDAQRSEEIASKVQEKVTGDMYLEKAIPKRLDYYRLDERQLASRVEAAFTRILSQGLEGLGLLSETNLVVRAAPAIASNDGSMPIGGRNEGFVPIGGKVEYFGRAHTVPANYLIADGREVRRDEYPELFAKFDTLHGHGDGLTTFNLPDLRGEFIRGADDMGTSRGARGVDGSRTVGSSQDDAFQDHGHEHNLTVNLKHSHAVVDSYMMSGNAQVLTNDDGGKGSSVAYSRMLAMYPYGCVPDEKTPKAPDGIPKGIYAGPQQAPPFEAGHKMNEVDADGRLQDDRWSRTTSVGNARQSVEGSIGKAASGNLSDETHPRNKAAIFVIRAR